MQPDKPPSDDRSSRPSSRASRHGLQTQDNLNIRYAALEEVQDAIVAVDTSGMVIYMNASAVILYRIEVHEAVAQKFTGLVDVQWEGGDDLEHVNVEIRKYGRWSGEQIHVGPDGRRIQVEVSLSALLDNTGARSGTLWIVRDITGRKVLEQALWREQSIAQHYLDIVDVMIMAIRGNGQVALINQKGCTILGRNEADIIGRDWFDHFVPERLREHVRSRFDQIVEGTIEANAYVENPILRPDGTERLIAWHNTVVANERDTVVATLSSGQDITESRAAEDALRRSEARNRALISGIPDLLIWIDAKGRLISVHSSGQHGLIPAVRNLPGRSLQDVLPDEIVDRYQQLVDAVHSTGVAERLEHTLPGSDGTVCHYEARVVLIEGNGVLVIVRDISELRTLEREVLRISDQERERIGRDLHDGLASHLSGIAMLSRGLASELRRSGEVTAEDLDEIADLAREGAEQARALAHGLDPIEVSATGFTDALADLAEHAQRLSRIPCSFNNGVTIPADLEDRTITHLYCIAREAISNAIRHSNATAITIELDETENGLQLLIADDGAGMPADREEDIGMGLHTMRYRSRLIGARFDVETRPGGGTVVTCELPLSQPDK